MHRHLKSARTLVTESCSACCEKVGSAATISFLLHIKTGMQSGTLCSETVNSHRTHDAHFWSDFLRWHVIGCYTPIPGVIDVFWRPLYLPVTAFWASETASVHRSRFCPSVLVQDSGEKKQPGGYERINGSTGPSIIPRMGVLGPLNFYQVSVIPWMWQLSDICEKGI